MTNRTHSIRHAGSAIAAALAIASTSGFAQDAAAPFDAGPEPVIVVPDIPVPAAPVPTVTLPTELPETPATETNVQPTDPVQAPSSSAMISRPRVTAPVASTAPEPVARVAAPDPAVVEPAAAIPPGSTVEPVAIEPVVPVATDEPARTATNDTTGILALVLGGLVFVSLAIWGFIAIGRRKHVRRYAAEITPKPAPVAPRPVVTAPVAGRDPIAFAPRAESHQSAWSFAQHSVATTGALPHAGASVALPLRIPEDYAERDALMKRMIAAKPDRANPFTDRGARTRRARLILQSLGRDFGEREPWIDLSQYPNNWPELADKRSAAA